jgi:hypothetical protein
MSITKTPASMIDPSGATNGQVLTFNGSTSTWVASSLSSNGFTASLSSNGYQKLPSGLIMQWGMSPAAGTDNEVDVTFPTAFTSAVYSVVVTQNAARADGGTGTVTVNNISVTGFSIQNGADQSGPFYWQAIGY